MIKKLNKKSFLYPLFLQFNSGFKTNHKVDMIENKKVPTCMISKLTLNQIKLDLIKSLFDYGIRIFFQTKYYADTSLSTTIILYNEKKLFGNKLTDKELLCKNDINYHKQVILSFLQKHERFSHFKKILNKNERDNINSPRGYINFENNQLLILCSKENKKLGEIDET